MLSLLMRSRMMEAIFGVKGKSFLILFYPRIAKMFPNWSGWNFLLDTLKPRQKLFRETIEEHSRTLPDGHARDFIDVYLQEVQRTTYPDSVFHKSRAGTTYIQGGVALYFAIMCKYKCHICAVVNGTHAGIHTQCKCI